VTWGANRAGQLGDGTTTNRPRPVDVPGLVGISTLALGDVHAIAVTSDGSVQTWGDRNPTPLTTIAGIENWGPPLGTVAAPAIDPPGGVYNTAQAVTLTAQGNFIDVRYTRDGTEPTSQSQRYVEPFVVSTATTVRARAFSAFSEVSAVSTAMFAFQFGELAAPVISPTGGTLAQAPVVTITSLPGASIRYTLDGTDPGDASALYTEPIQIPPAGAQLRARASHTDWTPSVVVSESYITDMTPPTIVAFVSPPLADGWMTTPVTVTFVCEDDSGYVVCSAPVVVDTDGRDQLIRGTATDAAGNHSSTSVALSVDLQPPSILVLESPDGQTVSEPDLPVTARITDAGSGVAQVSCNGDAVAVEGEIAACVVALRPGVNSITLQATDALGQMTSVGLTVSRIGASSTLRLSPAQRTMLANEVATFTLRDEYGAVVSAASWASSDPGIVTLSDDDPPLVTALAPGTTMIKAAKDGLSAEAEVHVRAGVQLDPGTTRWMVRPTPGLAMKFPLYTTRVDDTVPPLFLVESAVQGEATLYAATPDGEILWRQDSPGVPLMGDSFGGVIAGVLYEFHHSQYRALVRLGGAGGVAPWRYNSPGRLLAPAQALDGTIYAIEYILGAKHDGSQIWDKYATVIDGRNGRLLNRTLLPRETDVWTTSTSGCAGRHSEEAPAHAGPIVGPDGRGYLLVRRYARTKMLVCHDEFRMPRTIDVGVDLLVMSNQQSPVGESIHSAHCVAARNQLVVCDAAVDAIQVVPDGIGGILATWRRATHLTDPNTLFMQTSVTRRTDTGSFVDMPVPEHTSIYSVGQAGTALVIGPGTFSAIDVTSWTTKWSHSSSAGWPIAADPEGGAALLHPSTGALSRITSTGDVDAAGSMTLSLITAHHQFGSWIGPGLDGSVRSVVGEFADATRWHAFEGNQQRNLRLSTPGTGIFAKSHTVQAPITYQHVSLRITPTFQDYWRGLKPADFVNRDEFGNYFMTIGAGTAEGDTSLFCLGALTKGINRDKDVSARPVNLELLPVGPLEEVRLINDLYVYFGNYKNDLPYACVPEMHPGKYNSNSFASGLLRKARAPLPLFPTRGSIPPGWATPVPADKFNP
jgi:hypothetical protein